MIYWIFTYDKPNFQLPSGHRFIYIADTNYYIRVYAGGNGGPFLIDCPRGEKRFLSWPESINSVYVEFSYTAPFVDTPNDAQATIWFSEMPFRIESLSNTYKPVLGRESGTVAYPLDSFSDNGYAVPLGLIGGVEDHVEPGEFTSYVAKPVTIAQDIRALTGATDGSENRYLLRTASLREKRQTYVAVARTTSIPSSMSQVFGAAGRALISYLDLNQDEIYFELLSCVVSLYSVTAAVTVIVDLVRFEDTAGIGAITGLTERRLDDIDNADVIIAGTGFRCTDVLSVLSDEEVLFRKEFTLGITALNPTTNPIQIPLEFDLCYHLGNENDSPISPQQNHGGRRKFGVVVQVSGAVTTRTMVHWMWTGYETLAEAERKHYA